MRQWVRHRVVGLALLSGVGNSVIHPADYAILSGSVDRAKLGRSFAFHTFVGHVGFAAAPPVTAALALLLGWRGALLFTGLLGLPVVLAIIWQSRILNDQMREPRRRAATAMSGAGLLLSRSVMMFFAFFMVSSMAGAGISSWLITILHQVHGHPVDAGIQGLAGEVHPMDLLWFHENASESNGVSTFKQFGRAGVVTLRGNWSDIKTTYLGVKRGANNACEQGHYDLSRFVLDSSGVRWAMDLGPEDYNPPDYFDANMRACYHRARTIGHNTLTETAQRAT